MRKTENGFTGNEQHSAMARLSLDDMIDQLLHSNALSLKLTVPIRYWRTEPGT